MDVGPDNRWMAEMFTAGTTAKAGQGCSSGMGALLVGAAQVAVAITVASLVLAVLGILWYLFGR